MANIADLETRMERIKEGLIRNQLENDLSFEEKREIYEDITGEYVWNDLEDFVNENYSTPYDGLTSWHFGNKVFNADYFRMDGYGNIEGIYESDYEEEITDDLLNYHFEEVVSDYEDRFDLSELDDLEEELSKEDVYLEFEEENKQESDEFISQNVFFAFGDEQFNKQLEKRGWKLEDIGTIGCNGYCLKENVPKWVEIVNNKTAKFEEAKKDDDFFIGMLLYEMSNHEFGYTRDIRDTLDACGIEYKIDGWDIIIPDERINNLVNHAKEIAIKIDDIING